MGTTTGELVFFPRTGGVLYTPINSIVKALPGARQEKVSGRTRTRLLQSGLYLQSTRSGLTQALFAGYLSQRSGRYFTRLRV